MGTIKEQTQYTL